MPINAKDILQLVTEVDLENMKAELRRENEILLERIDRLLKMHLARGTEEKPKEFYTVRETAERLGVSKATVRNWCYSGILKATQQNGFNTLWLIPASEIQRMLECAERYE